MQISFHPSLAGRSAVAWPVTVTIAQGAGFDAVDLRLEEIAGETPESVRATLAASGLGLGVVPLPVDFRRDEQTFQDDLAKLPSLAGFAAEIGVRTMYRSLPASGSRPWAELGPILRRRLTACASVLRERGIGLALEVLGPLHRRREARYELIWRLPDCASFAEACGPGVGVLVDAWHWHHARGTTSDVADLGARILHVHVADAPSAPAAAIRDDERLLPGDGVIDLAGFCGALAIAGYDGVVTPEVPGGWSGSAAPAVCARRAREAVERMPWAPCTR